MGRGGAGPGGGVEGVLILNFALVCTKTLAIKPVPGFASLWKQESQTCQIISVKCCVYLYNNQTCQGIVNEIVREGSNAQTVNTLTLTLTPEALARSLFSSPLLLLVAWLLLSPFDHRSWCCEFQGRKKWQMPAEISWKVFFTNNSTSDSMKRQAKLSSSWGIITFFLLNLSDLATLSHCECLHKTGHKIFGRLGMEEIFFPFSLLPHISNFFFCRLVNDKKDFKDCCISLSYCVNMLCWKGLCYINCSINMYAVPQTMSRHSHQTVCCLTC